MYCSSHLRTTVKYDLSAEEVKNIIFFVFNIYSTMFIEHLYAQVPVISLLSLTLQKFKELVYYETQVRESSFTLMGI